MSSEVQTVSRSFWTVQHKSVSLLHPWRGARYCDDPVSVCVGLSVHSHISKTARLNFTKFSVHVTRGQWLWLGPLVPTMQYLLFYG